MLSWHMGLKFPFLMYKYRSHLFPAISHFCFSSDPRTPLKPSPVDHKQLQESDCFMSFDDLPLRKVWLKDLTGVCWNCRISVPSKTTTLGSVFFTRSLGHSYVQLKFEKHCDSVTMPCGSLVEMVKNYIIFYYKLCYRLNCIPLKFTLNLKA